MMVSSENIALIGFDSLNVRACLDRGVNVRWAMIFPNKDTPKFEFEFEYDNYKLFQNFSFSVKEGVPLDDSQCIDIWDQGFEVFRRHYFRMKFPQYKEIRQWNDVNNLFHMYAQFFNKRLIENKIDILFFMNIPHEGPLYVLYSVARALKIKTYVTKPGPHPCTLWIADGLEDFGTFETVQGAQKSYDLVSEPETPFYMKWKDVQNNRRFVRSKYSVELFKYVCKFALGASLWNKKSLSRSFERILSIHDKFTIIADRKSVNLDALTQNKYVYFALHRQPECSADTQGHEYGDQLYAVERLRFILPASVTIIVKENPKQVRHARPDSFFSRLELLENVRYVPSDAPTYELIRKSEFVATLAGTVGFESLVLGKAVIIFGDAWYSSLPGCFRYSPNIDVTSLMKFNHNREALESAYTELTKKLYPGVVEEAFAGIPDPDPLEYCKLNADTVFRITHRKLE